MLASIFLRDLLFAFRYGAAGGGLAFFLLVFLLFSFALGPEALPQAAPAIISVSLLLSLLLSLPQLYEKDQENGLLEQYLLLPLAAEWLALAKILAYWAAHALPLLIASPLLMAAANAELPDYFILRLIVASLAINATASISAALTLQHRKGGLARALILLPLTIPPLIFATTLTNAMQALPLLAAWALLWLPVSCYVSALLMKAAQE